MPSLLDDLDRLAHRGPHADPARVVAAALDAADSGRAAHDDREIDARASSDGPLVVLTDRARRRPAAWGLAAAALIGVGIAAVALGSGGSAGRPASTAAGPAAEPAPVATTPPLSAAEQSLQGLYLSLLDIGSRDDAVAAWSFNKPQSEVAACMATAGFEYTPGRDPAATADADSLNALAPADFAAEFGFGILTERAVVPDPAETANEGRRAAMTDDERARWDAAELECRTSPDRMAASNALQVALPAIRTKLLADPGMVTALETWRACVGTAGYSFDSPMAMRQTFYDRMNRGDSRGGLRAEEVATATATLTCNESYRATYRVTAIAHFPEFQELYDTALRLGLAPEAQG